jgi:hypothetical protein
MHGKSDAHSVFNPNYIFGEEVACKWRSSPLCIVLFSSGFSLLRLNIFLSTRKPAFLPWVKNEVPAR